MNLYLDFIILENIKNESTSVNNKIKTLYQNVLSSMLKICNNIFEDVSKGKLQGLCINCNICFYCVHPFKFFLNFGTYKTNV